MKRRARRLLSAVLAAVMALSLLPVSALAEEDEGASILIPVTDGSLPPAANAISLGDTPVYVSTDAYSVRLPEMELGESVGIASENARIQAMDGDSVVGQTAAFRVNTSTDSVGRNEDLYFFDQLEAGDYDLILTYGDVTTADTRDLSYVLTAVDAPVIDSGYLTDLTADGATLSLDISGYAGDPSHYSFQLVDMENSAEVSCEAKHIRTTENGYGSATLTYALTPQGTITPETRYALEITVDSGDLYSNASSISSTAQEPEANDLVILSVEADPEVTGGLTVTVAGAEPSGSYQVRATMGSSTQGEDVLYDESLTAPAGAGNWTISIVLEKNGLALPLSAYGSERISVAVEGDNGYDSGSYQGEGGYFNQYATLDLTRTGDLTYTFTLTGCNMLLDVYEVTAPQFSLNCWNAETYTDIQVATFTPQERGTYTENNEVYVEFSGTFTASQELTAGKIYTLYYDEFSLASTSSIGGVETEDLELRRLDINPFDYENKSFALNFGQLWVEATLEGAADETATITLLDLESQTVAATAGATGTTDEDGRMTFSAALEPESLDLTHTYQIQITCGGETVTSEDYGSTYKDLTYNDNVTPPSYFYVEEPVFAGGKTLTFRLSSYDMRNVGLDYFEDHPITVLNRATETAVTYTSISTEYRDGDWYVTLTLSAPLTFGTYDYGEYSSFEVLPAGGAVLGTAERNDEDRTVTIQDCRNLPEGDYTGILYNTYDAGYGKLANLTVTRQLDSELLVSDFPEDLAEGSYTIEIQCGESFLGTISVHLSWGDAEAAESPTIEGYARVYDGEYYQYEEIVYLTVSRDVALTTYLPGYAYVRYSENRNFDGAEYRPIREYYDQTLELSEGYGEKTVYVQFKKTNGTESPMYQWKCRLVSSLEDPAIVSAAVVVNGTATPLVPDNSTFTLEVVSTSQLVSVTAEFLKADGSADYRHYTLAYVEETEDGYLFRCELNSRDYAFRNSDFQSVHILLTDITGDTVYDEYELPIRFGDGIILDAWANDNEIYTKETDFYVGGYAPAYATISATWNIGDKVQERTVTASEEGRFTFGLTDLPETANRDEAKLTVTAEASGETVSETVYLYVDQTAPVVTELKAALTDEGNAVLTWKCEESNLAYYLLWRDGAPVWTADDEMTVNSYTAANGADVRFKVVAVDKAGNQSTAVEVTPGDTQPPTVPGLPEMTAHGTKSISFKWTAATDDVAVYAYEIYRGDEMIGEVDHDTQAYQDTGLTEDTEYQYAVYARDRAGNKSEAASASLKTAALEILNPTEFQDQYVKEEHPDGIGLKISAVQTDEFYDLWDVQAAFCYKAADAEEWTELELKTPTGRYAHWTGSWMIENLEPGTYTVCIRLTDPDGTVKETQPQSVTIVQDTTPPTVDIYDPLTGETLGGGKVQTVSFSSNDNVGVEKVELAYSTDGGETFTIFETIEAEEEHQGSLSKTVDFTETAELASGQITLRATAYDHRQNKGTSQDVTFTLDNTAPEAPGDFFVGGNSEAITVMWSYPDLVLGNDFRGFRVYRSTSADGEFACIKEVSSIGYFDTSESGVLADTTYYYYVTAVDNCGNESGRTETLSGQLTDDSQAPVIHSILPSGSTILQKSVDLRVSATDNYMLASCKIEYQPEGGTEWTKIADLTPASATQDYVYSHTWDLTDLSAGRYTVRYTVTDESGMTASETRTYTVQSYSAPQAPTLTAEAEGHKAVRLTWTYVGDPSTLRSFALYRGTGTDGDMSYICGLSADDREYLDHVRFDGESQEYRYQIAAIDQFGTRAESGIVSVNAVSNDSEPPIAVIGPDNLTYAAVGTPVALTGAASTDNDTVASYAWDFGDGTSGSGVETEHTYTTAGTYTVELAVTDTYGNRGTTTIEIVVVDPNIEDAGYTLLEMTVCDALTEAAIGDAEVTLDNGGETTVLWTDDSGLARCVVPNGSYTVGVYADGYLVRTITLKAEGGTAQHTIGLTNGSIMSGNLTATEMTYDEIVAAGIDPNAEGNQHVYKFAVELTFTVGLESYQLPYTVYKNANGQILRDQSGGGGFFTLGGGYGGGGGINIGLFPITENFVLVIYGEARWLKEMYNVELVVMNRSATDTLDQVTAELLLPEGLSLTDMVDGAQSAVQELGNVGHQETTSARWYVRGEKEGEYNLTAKVRAVSMPYGEVIEQTFTTQEPIKVYAGSALHLTVTAGDFTERGEQYPVTLRLSNVSDKPIYNLSFGVTGVEQFKVLRMGDQSGDFLIDGEDFEDQFTRTVRELPPGGYIEIEISSTIWFNSIAEVGEAALKSYLNTKGLGVLGNFVNVGYYLQDISVVTLEGSTATIPSTVQIKETDRPNFLLEVYEAAKALYKGEEPPASLMDLMVEVFGYDLPVYAQEGAKVILSLPKGTTEYDVRITLADGTEEDGALRNEYVSITSGTDTEMLFDTMNSVTISSKENGDFAINGLKAGETEMSISITDKDGFQTEYKMPLYINGEQVEVSFDLSMSPDADEFSVNSDMIGEIVTSLQEEERITFEDNPFLWFVSHAELNLEASEDGLEDILSLDEDALSDLLSETALSYLDVNGGVASLSLDRETLQQVENAKSDTEAVKIILRELGADVAQEKFGMDRPTYEFLIQVGKDAGKTVSEFGEGQVEVKIPYELQSGESEEDIVVHRVEEDGSYELVPSQYDSAAGLVSFTTDQFSYYRIGLKDQQVPDPDPDPEPEDPGTTEDPDDEDDDNRPSSGGSSRPSRDPVRTETTENEDGSVTTTVTNPSTGTTTETTEYPDGSELVVETKRNGTTTTTFQDGDGNETVTVLSPDGDVETMERRSDGVVVNTNTKGENTTATVTIPSRLDDGAEISIPVDLGDLPGIVSIEVNYRDGKDEVLVGDYDDGAIRVHLTGSATLEVLDDFTPATPVFADVPAGVYYADAVAWAVREGVTSGTSATTFSPNNACTRAQMVTFLWRAAGSPEPETTVNPFTDVSESAYYYEAVLWAVENGITNGTSATTFGPDATVTRGQTATFLWRNAGSPAASGNSFADVTADAYYATAVAWAAAEGITSGTSATTFSPDNACTRAQIVTFMFRDMAE